MKELIDIKLSNNECLLCVTYVLLMLSISTNIFFKGKLHFTTLNYTLDYTLHFKLFECTFYILNYDICYTLHSIVSFTIKLDGNL